MDEGITKTKNVQYAYVNIPAGVWAKGYEICSVDKPVETVKKSLHTKGNAHFHRLIHIIKNDRIFTKLFDEHENETDYATAITGTITKNGTKKEGKKFKKHGFYKFSWIYYGKNRYFALTKRDRKHFLSPIPCSSDERIISCCAKPDAAEVQERQSIIERDMVL